ncbi:MAG: hypothetical protein ABIA93_07830 [Candidatus Woesearchaeota archaeon]
MAGDPDFWKKAGYNEAYWAKHKANVDDVINRIKEKFPQLEGCFKKGLGADTSEYLKFKPNDKSEADIKVHKPSYVPLCDIEVTGSDRIVPGPTSPLWVLKSKWDYAKKSELPYWVVLIYPKSQERMFVVNEAIISKYEKNLVHPRIKIDSKTGAKIPETYIEIPASDALTMEGLFSFIQEELDS